MNVYHKLRPRTDIESCECLNLNGLLLVDLFTDNPLHCDFCRKEIDPERLQLTVEETEAVAGWFSVASALYRLWLDSGEYEQYAKERMLDVTSQVNRDGIAAAKMLSNKVPTRLWFFYDTDDGTPTECPLCCRQLNPDVEWGTGMCESCRIHI